MDSDAVVIAAIAVTCMVAALGAFAMFLAGLVLRRYSLCHGYSYTPGRLEFLRAPRGHVLRGTYGGHSFVLRYGLGDFLAEHGEAFPTSLSFKLVQPLPGEFRIFPAWPVSRRRLRTGDRDFDSWIRVEGSPHAFALHLLSDHDLRRTIRRVVSPVVFFTSRLNLTRAGSITVRHRSLFISSASINRDLRLLHSIAERVHGFLNHSGT